MRHVRTAETCLAAGLLACLLLALAAPRNPVAAAEAWLAAYVFWLGLPLGALSSPSSLR